MVGLITSLYYDDDQYSIRYNDKGLYPLYSPFFSSISCYIVNLFNFLAQHPIYTGNSRLHNGLVGYEGRLNLPDQSTRLS